jgi:hypothetical protein
VSGLKPDHFYNVRIIAVGSNNFQAGSKVIRLRTFGDDGRPRLGTSRLPSGFSQHRAKPVELDENGVPCKAVEATFGLAAKDEGPSAGARDSGPPPTGPASRRNTVGRKHSPSTTSLDKQALQEDSQGPSTAEMADLNQRYLSLRRETDDTIAAIAKEEEDNRRVIDTLEAEKQEKRKEQRKREEQTERLRKEQGATERAMRSALQRKTQKERVLAQKRDERSKIDDDMGKWEKGMAEMKKEQEAYEAQRIELEETRDDKCAKLREGNAAAKRDIAGLEKQLKDKRREVKELEEARKSLPGSEEDAEWREGMLELKRQWQRLELRFRQELLNETRRRDMLDQWIGQLSQHRQMANHAYGGYDPASYDMDQNKRRSRSSFSAANPIVSSPPQGYMDAAVSSIGFAPAMAPAQPAFVTGPYMGHSADRPEDDEANLRALMADAPLSPSATDHLLPSGIFADDEPPSSGSNRLRVSPFGPPGQDNDPQSPASSSRSMSILSSRHGSSNNLPFPQYSGEASERRSLKGPLSSPITAPGQPAGNKFGNLFNFPRSRGAKNLEDDDGPALGSLKPGQSQSFPRQGEDAELANKSRRISLSSWGMFNRNSAGPEMLGGNLPLPSKPGFSARNLLPFGNKSGILHHRDPSSPRPASIASIDVPRPSTDSASIWGPPGDAGAIGRPSRLWSPDNAWSRNASRRPSLHGSPSALKTNLASADDEILDDDSLLDPQNSPSQVGVIGSRPPAAKKSIARTLNPAAPTFMAKVFGPKTDKDKEAGEDKKKGKGKDRLRDKNKSKAKDASPETPGAPSIMVDESPSESRVSRDALSVHTQTSVSESRESLTLERSFSHATSEVSAGTPKEPDNAFRKLFRKDSTSKLSFSQKFKRAKSGPGSVANSDKNEQRSSMGDLEDGEDGVLVRGGDSVTSSPSLGPARFKDNAGGKLRTSGSWFSIKKKNREKESLEMDRASEADTTNGEEERRV